MIFTEVCDHYSFPIFQHGCIMKKKYPNLIFYGDLQDSIELLQKAPGSY